MTELCEVVMYIVPINSTRNGLGELVIDSGEYEATAFGTKRTKWKAR